MLLLRYLKKYMQKNNICLPVNYKDKLKEYKNMISDTHIIFSSVLIGDNDKHINANGTYPCIVVFNNRWAANIIFNDSEETRNAFLVTVGHELGHKQGRDLLPLIYLHPSKIKFVAWVNEIHADFFGVRMMRDGKRDDGIRSCVYKKNLKEIDGCEDVGDLAHPSWQQRIQYMEHYNFGSELIKQIAIDTGCEDQKLISKVCDRFEKIKLT